MRINKHQIRKLIIVLVLGTLSLNSCKQDSDSGRTVSETNQFSSENIKSLILKKDTISLKDSTELILRNDSKSRSPKSEIKESAKVKKEKLKIKEKKAKIVEQKIKESSYKKMNCKKMIIKYKNIIEEYKKTGNDELLLWKDTNDPIYKFCYEKNIEVFDSLEKVENSLFEDEEY